MPSIEPVGIRLGAAAGALMTFVVLSCTSTPAAPRVELGAPDVILLVGGRTQSYSLANPASLPPAIALAPEAHFEEDPTWVSIGLSGPRPRGDPATWEALVLPADTTLVTFERRSAFEGSLVRKRSGRTTIEFRIVDRQTRALILGPYRADFTVEP